MTETPTPFARMHAEYAWRLSGAAVCVTLATAAARLLYAGALPEHWVVELVTVCLAGSIGGMLGLDVLQRYVQLRRLRMIEAAKPYGTDSIMSRSETAENLAVHRKPTRH